jgi:hypothetical protein
MERPISQIKYGGIGPKSKIIDPSMCSELKLKDDVIRKAKLCIAIFYYTTKKSTWLARATATIKITAYP